MAPFRLRCNDFSIKNYQYFLKHNKVKKEIVKPIINSSIFTIDDCDLDDIMPLSTSKEEVIKEKANEEIEELKIKTKENNKNAHLYLL